MYVYILRCNNGRYYIGSTPDIDRRIHEHQSGKNEATKHLLPVTLVFSQRYATLPLARRAEYWLKKQKDRSLVERIILEGKLEKQFG